MFIWRYNFNKKKRKDVVKLNLFLTNYFIFTMVLSFYISIPVASVRYVIKCNVETLEIIRDI